MTKRRSTAARQTVPTAGPPKPRRQPLRPATNNSPSIAASNLARARTGVRTAPATTPRATTTNPATITNPELTARPGSQLAAAGSPSNGPETFRPAPTPPGPTRTNSSRPIPSAMAPAARAEGPRWTFLTNHAHVLVLLFQNPVLTVREVARQVGITERAVQSIVAELEEAGILQRTRVGRQNHYQINPHVALRHPIESHRTIGELLQLCAHPPAE